MKVALISYDHGEYCVRLAAALAEHADVLLLLPEDLAAPHVAQLVPGVRFVPFRKPRLRQPVAQVRTACELLRCVRQFRPDVVHLQQGHLWLNAFRPLIRGVPLVLTVHDARHHPGDAGGRRTPQAVLNFGFRRATRLVVHAGEIKRLLQTHCGIAGELITVIPMIEHGTRGVPCSEHGSCRVLFFGRIWPYKGLEYLIRAEPLITEAVPDAQIVIAGVGENFARYRQMMVHPDRFIVYNEYVSHDRQIELFAQASVVVLPYVEASQSAVIPVAYSFGKPVVATTVGGLPELVDDGRTGVLVPPRDERALAAAVVRLLRDSSLRRQLGVNGQRKLEQECSGQAVARHTVEVYARALNRVRPLATVN